MKIGQRDVAPDCGCSVKGYTSLDDALSIIDGAISALPGMETLPLTRVSGRILAREVRNPAPLPRFDNAAMDGYAVASSSFKGTGPWVLPVMGRCAAGEIPRPLVPGTAMRILHRRRAASGRRQRDHAGGGSTSGGRHRSAHLPRSGGPRAAPRRGTAGRRHPPARGPPVGSVRDCRARRSRHINGAGP